MGAGPLCKVNIITLATPLPSPIINFLLPPLQKVAVYWLLTPPMLQAVYSLASGSHLYSGSQTVDYVANLTHNNSVLICQVTAANHSHYLVILVNKTYSGLCQTGPVGHGKGKSVLV